MCGLQKITVIICVIYGRRNVALEFVVHGKCKDVFCLWKMDGENVCGLQKR